MKKIIGYIVAFVSGIVAILLYITRSKDDPRKLPTESIKEDLKSDIEKIEEKQKDLKENGTKKLTPDEVEEYWKNN